jgi:Protein of unknown function (DUF2905)
VGDPVQSPVRVMLIAIGGALLLIGLAWPVLSRYLGKLPGDIVVRREGWTFAFPIVTCLVLSLILSLIFWIFRR